MHYFTLNVFIISFLTWSSPVSSQTPLAAAISDLNPCANNCISRAAAFVKCGATDFGCQCAHQNAIIGPDKVLSPQGGCILHDCGASNATDVRSTFNRICGLEAASSQVGNLPPASSQASASTPTTTPIDTPVDAPTSTPAVVPQTTPDLPPSAAPTPAISSIVSDVPAPSPVQTTAQAQAPASLTPSAETSPTDAPIPASTTSLPDNTPPPAQASSSISIPAAFTPAPQESAISSSITAFSIYESEAIPASPTSTQASTAQASSIAESNSNEQSTTSPTSTNKHLAPLAIAGITILVLGFVATIVSLASIQLRRRKRKSYIASQRLEEKLRPMTEDGPSPPNSSGRGLPWDSRRQNKASAVMGIEVGPRQPESEERPKSRGKGAGESGNNVPPSSFPMLGIGTGAPQGVNTQSPPGSGNSIKRTGTGGGAGAQQPLKSAMKKPRDRPKSRPLIIADGKEMNFGFNPLGSNPRSPT